MKLAAYTIHTIILYLCKNLPNPSIKVVSGISFHIFVFMLVVDENLNKVGLPTKRKSRSVPWHMSITNNVKYVNYLLFLSHFLAGRIGSRDYKLFVYLNLKICLMLCENLFFTSISPNYYLLEGEYGYVFNWKVVVGKV